MTWFTADSYKNWELIDEPFEINGRMYSKAKAPCPRCGGYGIIVARVENGVRVPIPVDGGVCYKCHGEGKVYDKIRLYTKKEKESLDRQKAARKEKKEREEQERKNRLMNESDANKKSFALSMGFNDDLITYIIIGEDTFSIKNYLKEQGCKFESILLWHSPKVFDLPEGYSFIAVAFDEVFQWFPLRNNGCYIDDAKTIIDEKIAAAANSSSQYIGSLKERLRDVPAILKAQRGFESRYGYVNLYEFQSGDNILVWFASSPLDLKKGDKVSLTGTVVEHKEYRGVKQTRINRCKIEKVENKN